MECTLGTGELLRLAGGAAGVRLHCLTGTVWLTNGDGQDYLVHRGHSFALAAGTAAVVEALGLAEVRLESAAQLGAGIRPVLTLDASRACC